ncbi:MAG: FAD-dependent oxidoreductase [Deltaproteobacteria bacterium]|nr:FAD-dependent oxidoreductase [Deltaproteobacteria bacterium]
MGDAAKGPTGPDLAAGVTLADLREGVPLLGHVGDDAVMLVKSGAEVFATGATCTHYSGPLAEGLVVDGTVRCPWHHACFDLRTGEAKGPALNALACHEVVREGALVKVGGKKSAPRAVPSIALKSVVIVGAGPAGLACAETLRAHGHEGAITMIGAEPPGPVDRPNLSKDYLAGTAPEEWIPLRGAEQLADNKIDLVLDAATRIDTAARTVTLQSGRTLGYDALLYATGAEPIVLPIEGVKQAHVHTLRSLADSRAIAKQATSGGRAVVIGASFIGLEAAMSLRARGVEVTVVAPETIPLARILGDQVGKFVQGLHEAKGVHFRLGKKPARIDGSQVVLDSGEAIPAELVVMGVGVRPRLDLAKLAGLTVDNGVVVDAELRASAPGVWAAGDVARFPRHGELVRIEHWQLAERQGRHAALSMLGRGSPFSDVPFFWSAHGDVSFNYVGHALAFDAPEVHGSLEGKDAHVVYRKDGKVKAVVTLWRDALSLEVEAAMERGDEAAVERLVAK